MLLFSASLIDAIGLGFTPSAFLVLRILVYIYIYVDKNTDIGIDIEAEAPVLWAFDARS